MNADQSSPNDKPKSITLRLLDELFSSQGSFDVGVRLWDGTFWPDDRPRAATIVLNHPGALRSMFVPANEVNLAEAYLYNDFDVEGEIERVYGLADGLAETSSNLSDKIRLGSLLLKLPAGDKHQPGERGPAQLRGERHTIERDRQAVTYHYDVSNDFYALWLDRNLVYSCAYFQSAEEDLDPAQERKLNYICRKLRLQKGQRLLDIGCGWGGLVAHAAKNYGVQAVGITLSQPQAELANQRLAEAGLDDRAQVKVLDYRQVDEAQPYDALVSVGMFEHVGAALLPVYFQKARQLLRPGGVFLNHGIASNSLQEPRQGLTFSQTYVFPDGELTPINISLNAAEEAGFEVRDVESLRDHYALTLRHWVRRLEEHHQQALEFVTEPTYRVWRLFMSASAYGFSTGRLNVYQSLLVKQDQRGASGLPLTRSDWYLTA
jgi:cyclopropane-fatty-acyl-phospholipid synthase